MSHHFDTKLAKKRSEHEHLRHLSLQRIVRKIRWMAMTCNADAGLTASDALPLEEHVHLPIRY